MIKFKKSLGQNFLTDKNIIKKITSLETVKGKYIFEIGPGEGSLTNYLLEKKPKKIILVEKDTQLVETLKNKYAFDEVVEIFNDDILDFNVEKIINQNTIIFGNLPYNISSQILVKFIKFTQWPPKYNKLIFMFQKEVADKIMAKVNTKNYGRLSIIANWRLKVVKRINISRNCFYPIPKVDSSILVFKPKENKAIKIKDINNLEKITHVFFSGKRKMINKSFAKIFKDFTKISKKLKINLSIRPGQLQESDYYKIVEHFETKK